MTARMIDPDLLLSAYAVGIFPMAQSREDDDIGWYEPQRRGVLPLDGFHLSASLAKAIRRGGHEVAINRDFAGMVAACAARDETWINATIQDTYLALHRAGHAHSLEIRRDGALAGGLFGVALGGAFFGESMVSRERDASKIALAYLVDRLRRGGFRLLDTQFMTDHLARLGGVEISRAVYRTRLAEAVRLPADFIRPEIPAPAELLASLRNA